MIALALLALAPVLAHPVERGAILSAEDFIEDGAYAPPANAVAPEQAIGKEATRWLPAGAVLRTGDVAAPRLVRRGETVSVRVLSGGLTVATSGRALADGRAGESVRVLATATRRTLGGVVDGPGTVRVIAP